MEAQHVASQPDKSNFYEELLQARRQNSTWKHNCILWATNQAQETVSEISPSACSWKRWKWYIKVHVYLHIWIPCNDCKYYHHGDNWVCAWNIATFSTRCPTCLLLYVWFSVCKHHDGRWKKQFVESYDRSERSKIGLRHFLAGGFQPRVPDSRTWGLCFT